MEIFEQVEFAWTFYKFFWYKKQYTHYLIVSETEEKSINLFSLNSWRTIEHHLSKILFYSIVVSLQ